MAAPLSDGQVEYEDDTEATVSQMARDVSSFLQWASEPEQDDRKFKGCQFAFTLVFILAISGYYKRFTWCVFYVPYMFCHALNEPATGRRPRRGGFLGLIRQLCCHNCIYEVFWKDNRFTKQCPRRHQLLRDGMLRT